MRRILLYTCLLFALPSDFAHAQQADGKINSLLSAENYFSSMVKMKGLKKAFLMVSDEETIIFRPGPVKAKAYFEKQEDGKGYPLSWQPSMARISKSGDWGFTSGTFNIQPNVADSAGSFGQYLSVWKVNAKGIWKLALDLGIEHPEIKKENTADFKEPKNAVYFRQASAKRLAQREDVVLINDRLFSTTMANQGLKAYREFLANQSRLLFPGKEPIIGKENILNFWAQNPYQIISTPLLADRSLSGDWAYTQGEATLNINAQAQSFYYVRIWELQQGFNWNLVLEIFVPASK